MTRVVDMNIIDAAQMQTIPSYSGLVDWLRECHLESVDAMEDRMLTQPAATNGEDTLPVRVAWQRSETIGIKLTILFPGKTAAGDMPVIQAAYV